MEALDNALFISECDLVYNWKHVGRFPQVLKR
jgi:hypothetical protein